MFDKVNISVKRELNESFKDYKNRVKKNSRQITEYLKGKCFHNSSINGTYRERKS